jgi:N6-L-threonylcarbamoyladenine synthase
MGALMVGVSFAKGMALGLDIPLIEVNHMHAHIMAHFIQKPNQVKPVPSFPFLCLTVSGGHTQLIVVNDYLNFKTLGQTKDDAAGEAFDKGAKMLGLPYPGGPLVDQYAKDGNSSRFSFPVTSMSDYDFSFSGIKTALLYFLRDWVAENPNFINENLNDICASYQCAIIEMLMIKLKKAAHELSVGNIALAGGVAANSALRNALKSLGKKNQWQLFIPDFEYCTDNAAMIAITAHYKYLKGDFCNLDIAPVASLQEL